MNSLLRPKRHAPNSRISKASVKAKSGTAQRENEDVSEITRNNELTDEDYIYAENTYYAPSEFARIGRYGSWRV